MYLLVIVISDNQIKRLKAQDPNAFNEFYLDTVDMFFRYINSNYFLSKEDAEDLISDFYVRFWEAVKQFDENLSFTAYFWTIFKNIIKDHFKKHHEIAFTDMKQSDEDQDFGDTLVDDFDALTFLDDDFSFERIQKVMGQLDDISRDIIYFKFIEEKTNEEIARIT
ncbi:MAG: sigma-70 family RNA polymerase sigma factor [bacterium]